MEIAKITAQRSPDPNTQVGACIVSPDNRILATGYNSFPRGIPTDAFPWNRTGDPLDTKYLYVVHAEANAVHNKTNSLVGSTCYVTLFPCNKCMQALIQEGVKRIVYLEDKYPELPETKAAKLLAWRADVTYIQYKVPEPK